MKKSTLVINSSTTSTLTVTAKGVSLTGAANFNVPTEGLTLGQLAEKLNLFRTMDAECPQECESIPVSQLVRGKIELKPGVAVSMMADVPEVKAAVPDGTRKPIFCIVADPDLLEEMYFVSPSALRSL